MKYPVNRTAHACTQAGRARNRKCIYHLWWAEPYWSFRGKA